jgi:hypothetical protein
MKGKYFLSDVMTNFGTEPSKDRLEPHCINLIEAPCGSGKTHLILNHLIKEYPDKRKILYLIDTRGGNTQLVEKHPDCIFYDNHSDLWRWNINNTLMWGHGNIPDKIVVMTYHKLAYLQFWGKEVLTNFDLIIADEIHNLHKFQTYYKADEPNILRLSELWLRRAMNNANVRIVALTATPDRTFKMFPENKTRKVLTADELQELKEYENITEKVYLSIDNIIEDLPAGRGIIFVYHIREMRKYAEMIKNKYPDLNVNMIWSLNTSESGKDPMTLEQYEIWASIFNDEVVPSDIDVLFINASCETAINIQSKLAGSDENYKIDYMAIKSFDEDVAVQVRGRYRDDLDLCCFYANMPVKEPKPLIKTINVPPHFLNKPLFKDDIKILCDEINYRKNGRRQGFPTIKNMLLETSEYDITEGRSQKNKKDKIYYEISLKT